jgi:hypothetical protein
MKTYQFDGREIEILENIPLLDVVEAIKTFFDEYNCKKQKQCEL